MVSLQLVQRQPFIAVQLLQLKESGLRDAFKNPLNRHNNGMYVRFYCIETCYTLKIYIVQRFSQCFVFLFWKQKNNCLLVDECFVSFAKQVYKALNKNIHTSELSITGAFTI